MKFASARWLQRREDHQPPQTPAEVRSACVSCVMLALLFAIKDCRIDLVSGPMTDGTWLPE
jgi:hypothetical protein